MMRLTLLAVLAAASAACSPLTVTFHSDPEGATLYANASQTNFGATPVTLHYKPSRAFLAGTGCDVFQGAMARWPSGATAAVSSLRLCPQDGRRQQITLVRPSNAPGLDHDISAAFRQQELAQQAEAAETERRREARRQATESPAVPQLPPLNRGSVIESRIDGDFEGWDGDTVFVLQNGQIWKQASYHYYYHYAYAPRVVIYRTSTGYELKVDGVGPTIKVEQLR